MFYTSVCLEGLMVLLLASQQQRKQAPKEAMT